MCVRVQNTNNGILHTLPDILSFSLCSVSWGTFIIIHRVVSLIFSCFHSVPLNKNTGPQYLCLIPKSQKPWKLISISQTYYYLPNLSGSKIDLNWYEKFTIALDDLTCVRGVGFRNVNRFDYRALLRVCWEWEYILSMAVLTLLKQRRICILNQNWPNGLGIRDGGTLSFVFYHLPPISGHFNCFYCLFLWTTNTYLISHLCGLAVREVLQRGIPWI